MVNNKEGQDATGISASSGIKQRIWCAEAQRECLTGCSRYNYCHPRYPEAPASTTNSLQPKLQNIMDMDYVATIPEELGKPTASVFWHGSVIYCCEHGICMIDLETKELKVLLP
jgi:hypothetical protein